MSDVFVVRRIASRFLRQTAALISQRFPMFVPSLSWQMFGFYAIKWRETFPHRSANSTSSCTETPFVLNFLLCLSRACLGIMIVLYLV